MASASSASPAPAASSASPTPASAADVEGYASGYVHPRTHCPHLPSSQPTSYPPMGTLCKSCESPQENWVCLTCQNVGCGRYINGHMLEHSQSVDHPIAASYSDLSVWCFKCDAYLDAQAIPELRSPFTSLYRMKFGETPQFLQEDATILTEG